MSGGGVHCGVGDGQPVARIRPEAVGFAAKHAGSGMSAVMTRVNYRPQSAPAAANRKSVGPIPGYSNETVATMLATVPRVKPEAMANAQRATGSMANVMAQVPPRPHVTSYSIDAKPRPKTAAPTGPIVHDGTAKNIAIVAPRVKPEAAKIANISHQGMVGKIFCESYENARRANLEQSMKNENIPKAKNHLQANVTRMRQIQKQAREREKQKVTKFEQARFRKARMHTDT